jgi:hypothetical protein
MLSVALSLDFHGFDADGVKLIPPTAPEFDDLARPLIGERVADTVLQLKPMLFIVSNESSQPVVSYSKFWRITYADGRTGNIRSHTSFPEAVCGDVLISNDPQALRPGDKRIEASGIVIHGAGLLDPYYDQFLAQFVAEKNATLHNARNLSTELNAAIFADGTSIGRDEAFWLSEMFARRIAAKQEWYRGIIEALDRGQTIDEAFRPVASFMTEVKMKMRTNPHEYFRYLREHGGHERQDAASDAARWRRHFSDEELPGLLRGAIRLAPFIIRKRDS